LGRVSIRGDQRAQASVELVAILPLLLVLLLAIGQLVVAGYALWSAGSAARAGARAAHVGGDPKGAARSALPEPLRTGARVRTDGPVEVRVQAPPLIRGLPSIPVTASAELGAGVDGGS
jgi:hypothetical protein